ncbi:hypothetical protein OH786_08625 [Streptomyces atratus]|uniref:Alpha fucosidase A-like C-terminal domain-containing protein n=1 Tax=Streptomyces atratus TaxID=1893 RepID=A0A1K1TWL0_STRAR|nr:hypothetical protein [Streptomyces atratus]SFX04904.1 hypothetical protein SAMN02787144_1001287 [Streptomyces atratus]
MRRAREGPDGRLHLPRTRSPEYANAADCTYDLSLIRWGVRTLSASAKLLRNDDPRLGRWQDIERRLAPYAEDPAAGVMIGKDVPLAGSHRHHSHLLWLYPLRERSWDRAGDREVMRRSMDHWVSMQQLWHGRVAQSHEGVVKVFPSVSERWADASIASLRAQGAFLVDADRSGGATRWVRVHSEAGAPLTLDHSIRGGIEVRDAHGRTLHWWETGPGRITLALPRGGTAVVTPQGSRRPRTDPRDVPSNGDWTRWGLPG